MVNYEFLSLFIFIAGLIIGLGAVTVIDIHGFLARKSSYWTIATIRTHKITKPLIWVGIILSLVGGSLYYYNIQAHEYLRMHLLAVFLMVINGLFLSFVVSPYLLKQETEGNQEKLLPQSLQNKITISFIISFIGWWGLVALLTYSIVL